MKHNVIEKSKFAKSLLEALPYVQAFSGKIMVIKFGGNVIKETKERNSIVKDIAFMHSIGFKVVIVHGGGSEISEFGEKLGIKSYFIDGLRVSDKETVSLVQMVLSGKVSKEIIDSLRKEGVQGVSITGKDADIFLVEKKEHVEHDLGFVGNIKKCNSNVIKILLQEKYLPVVTPLGFDSDGETYNINADYAAVELAHSLSAEKLIFMSDVPGILKDKDDKSSLISRVDSNKIKELIKDKIIVGGMIPKATCALEAINRDVNSVHIIDGTIEHSILLEVFADKGIGTMVTK